MKLLEECVNWLFAVVLALVPVYIIYKMTVGDARLEYKIDLLEEALDGHTHFHEDISYNNPRRMNPKDNLYPNPNPAAYLGHSQKNKVR